MTLRLLVLCVSAALAACTASGPQPLPSEADARAYVAQMVQLARAGDLEGLCAIGGGNCEDILAVAGPIPAAPPTIVSITPVPNRVHADGSWLAGGQLVELRGHVDSGATYCTRMLVFRDHQDQLIAIEPIYWSGMGIITGGTPATVPVQPAGDCPHIPGQS